MSNRQIDPVAFVEAWLAGDDIDTISKKSGCAAGAVYVYAGRLRKKGVKLPERSRPTKNAIDVAALNLLIRIKTTPSLPPAPKAKEERFAWTHDSPNCDNNCDCYERALEHHRRRNA